MRSTHKINTVVRCAAVIILNCINYISFKVGTVKVYYLSAGILGPRSETFLRGRVSAHAAMGRHIDHS